MKNKLFLFGAILLATLNSSYQPTFPTATKDDNLAFGNPSNAVSNLSAKDNYLITKNQFSLSYNASKGIPNWVSWHLSTAWMGKGREGSFKSDPNTPAGCNKITTRDYTNSGFDRGHICPSADRNISSADNKVTFFMTNIIPQSPICNQQTWKDLEDYCRGLAKEGNELYIVAGQSGIGGTGENGRASYIANGKVAVPKYVWKAILVLPNGSDDIKRVDENTRVIAVIMPNRESVNQKDWFEYRVSVDKIEESTGYDLFSKVNNQIEAEIESIIDDEDIW